METQEQQEQEQETPQKPNDYFFDAEGRMWKPRVTTPVLIDGCMKCNIEIKDLFKGKVNAGSLVRFVWFACAYQADAYGIKNEAEFMDKVLTLDKVFDAMTAIGVAVVDTLPEVSSALHEVFKDAGPLGNGD